MCLLLCFRPFSRDGRSRLQFPIVFWGFASGRSVETADRDILQKKIKHGLTSGRSVETADRDTRCLEVVFGRRNFRPFSRDGRSRPTGLLAFHRKHFRPFSRDGRSRQDVHITALSNNSSGRSVETADRDSPSCDGHEPMKLFRPFSRDGRSRLLLFSSFILCPSGRSVETADRDKYLV